MKGSVLFQAEKTLEDWTARAWVWRLGAGTLCMGTAEMTYARRSHDSAFRYPDLNKGHQLAGGGPG